MSRLLPEWLNANYHKAYPFDESTAAVSGSFPSTFLLDMQLLTGGPVNAARTYIGRIEQDGSSVSLYLFTVPAGTNTPTELGLLARIPFNTAPETDIQVELKNADAGVLLNGYVTVGSATDISWIFPNAVMEIAEDAGLLYEGVVVPVTNWTSGMIVDGQLIAGDVNLIAGDGIQFRVATISVDGVEQPVVYIDCVDSVGSTEGSINSDKELADYIYGTYGMPIYSINGVYPDASGNVQIKVTEADADDKSPSITITPSGTGCLVINDARTKPCCTLDDQQLVIDNIAAVNDRAARIEATITAVETNLNGMSAQLALIGAQ